MLLLMVSMAKLGESAFLNEVCCRGTALDPVRHSIQNAACRCRRDACFACRLVHAVVNVSLREGRMRIFRLLAVAATWRIGGDFGALVLGRYRNGAHSMMH